MRRKVLIIALLLTSALTISLTACDNSSPSSELTINSATTSEKESDRTTTTTVNSPPADTSYEETSCEEDTEAVSEEETQEKTTEEESTGQTSSETGDESLEDTTEESSTEEEATEEETTPEATTEIETTTEAQSSSPVKPEDTTTVPVTTPLEATPVQTTAVPTTAPTVVPPTVPVTKPVETTPVPTTTPAETTTPAPTTTAPVVATSIAATVSGSHYVGDTLKASDFYVVVFMSDGSYMENPAGWTASSLSLISTSNTITVSYAGLSTSVKVSASERPTEAPTEAPTQPPTEPPTVAPTTEAPTTEAPTQAPSSDLPANGTVLREASIMYFNLLNEERASLGIPQLTWDEDLYERACKCALAVAEAIANGAPEDNSLHDYTVQYRYKHITGASGYEYDVGITENLCQDTYYAHDGAQAESMHSAIKFSQGHYKRAISSYFDNCGVAIIFYNGRTVGSSLFWNSNEYLYY